MNDLKNEKRIYRWAATTLLLVVVSFLLPRVLPTSGEGFGAAASAILVFIVSLSVSLVISLRLLALTMRHFGTLGPWARVVGLAPCVIISAGLVFLFLYLSF